MTDTKKTAQELTQQQAEEVLLRLLARREHSALELKQKLRQRGFTQQPLEAALAKAQQLGWQSDQRFTESWVKQCLEKGDGVRKIQAQAQQKGISEALLQQVLLAHQPDWHQQCYQRLIKKFGEQPPIDQKQRDKMIRHLLQRGFSFDSIKIALQRQSDAAAD